MSDPSFRAFLAVSLATLRRECPAAHEQMCRQLDARRVRLRVGSEEFGLSVQRDVVRLGPRPVQAHVDVETDRRTILDVVAARASLLDVVVDERLHLRGAADELLRFHDALLSYVAGAVRSPTFPNLLDAYARPAEAKAER